MPKSLARGLNSYCQYLTEINLKTKLVKMREVGEDNFLDCQKSLRRAHPSFITEILPRRLTPIPAITYCVTAL